jgi:hypothetical protein
MARLAVRRVAQLTLMLAENPKSFKNGPRLTRNYGLPLMPPVMVPRLEAASGWRETVTRPPCKPDR